MELLPSLLIVFSGEMIEFRAELEPELDVKSLRRHEDSVEFRLVEIVPLPESLAQLVDVEILYKRSAWEEDEDGIVVVLSSVLPIPSLTDPGLMSNILLLISKLGI